MNNKIMKHLASRASKRNNKNDQKILDWLSKDDHQELIWEPTYISQDLDIKGGSLYNSIYRLASQNRIGFASRDYQVFRGSSLGHIAPRVKILVWYKGYEIEEPEIKEKWRVPISSDQIMNVTPMSREIASGSLSVSGSSISIDGIDLPAPRGSLFPIVKTPQEIINAASAEDLQTLIDLAKKRQIQIGIDRRYACLSKAHRDLLVGVFSGIGITDPVYFAHSDDDISFLTYTAVPDMPIDVVIDEGNGPRHISAKHLTLFGERLITYTDSMFSGGNE